MLGKIFGIICLISVFFGIICGNMSNVGNAVIDGASGAVSLTVSLVGMMCLWCGIMKVFQKAGILAKISHFIRPLLRFYFPDTCRSGHGIDEIAANISANFLGIGNAATPMALDAMRKMQENNPSPEAASDDMITLAVLNTASVSILPSTVIALRRAAGAAAPYSVIVPVWIVSFCTSLFALTLTKICRRICARRDAEEGKTRRTANKNAAAANKTVLMRQRSLRNADEGRAAE